MKITLWPDPNDETICVLATSPDSRLSVCVCVYMCVYAFIYAHVFVYKSVLREGKLLQETEQRVGVCYDATTKN